MTKDEAKLKIIELVKKYEQVIETRSISKYTEEETKKDFIQPLFHILGWDTQNKNEVTAEEYQQSGRPDYGFYLNGRCKFFVEAKALKTNLHNEEFANQAVRYSWNKGVTWAVLTDFESLKVFNAQVIDKSLFDKLFFEIKYTEYVDRFDQLWLLSKKSFEDNLLDAEGEKFGKKLQRVSVSELLYKDLNECRSILTNFLGQCNPNLDKDLLDEGVQKLLDRLIFLRVAEDRGIEGPILKELIREYELKGGHKFQSMVKIFRELDEVYNSSLFSEHSFEKWEEYGGGTEKVIKILYGKSGYYEYDFKAMPVDVLGGVYENYLGYKLSKSKKGLSINKDATKRKEQGIYYTPDFIVDYIVKNTLKPVLNKCKSIEDLKKIKVLDPACGSGSFLIKALEVIYEKYKEFNSSGGVLTKIQILQENIFGVDLDNQAVEIARLNLLISALDTRMKLPSLDKNIKNGNSLISGTDEELKKYFGKNYRDKKPFNWQEEFPQVFKQGGFDVILANPPYLKELDNKELFREISRSNFGNYYEGKMDFWYFFLHRSIEILKIDGIAGFVTNSYFLKSAGAKKLIEHLKNEMVLIKAVDFQDMPIFKSVSGRHLIHIWKKSKNKDNSLTKYIKIDTKLLNGIIDENKAVDLPYSQIIKNSSINFESGLKINTNTTPLGELYDVSQGVIEATDKVSKKMLMEMSKGNYKIGQGVFVVSQDELANLDLNANEEVIIKKYLNTNNVKKYSLNFDNEYLIYSDKIVKTKIASDEYLHIKDHLNRMNKFITSSNAPYGLHRPRESKYFEDPKLICKGMFLDPEFTYDEEKYYVGFSFSVIIRNDKRYDLKYLLALLNSEFGKQWFNSNGKKRGVGVDIGVAVFRKFPVFSATKDQQELMIDLVDKILVLNKEIKNVTENSEKWLSTKSEIQKIDKTIDQEVYKLYGLTDDKIKTFEASVL